MRIVPTKDVHTRRASRYRESRALEETCNGSLAFLQYFRVQKTHHPESSQRQVSGTPPPIVRTLSLISVLSAIDVRFYQPRPAATEVGEEVTDWKPLPQRSGRGVECILTLFRHSASPLAAQRVSAESGYMHSSAINRSASGWLVPMSNVLIGDDFHRPSWSRIRSFGPTSATASTNSSGTAACASFFLPER